MRSSDNTDQDYPATLDGQFIDVDGIWTFYIDKGQDGHMVMHDRASDFCRLILNWCQ